MVTFIFVILWLSASFAANDELFLSTPQILEHRNIAYENHTVITEDGYILTVFRIPKKNRLGVVLLQHSSSLDSSVFLVSAKRSVAMDIFNAGYEIWLPNFRGLPFSTRHTNPNIKPLEYWDFSYHEIGYYDFPAIINHVTKTTGSKLFIINHSSSSTAALVYSSLRPKESKENVKLFINMASSAFMNHTKFPFKEFFSIESSLVKPIMDMMNMGALFYDFMPYIKIFKQFLLNFQIQKLTEMLLEIFFGAGIEMDPEEFPMIVSVSFQTICAKILRHYGQNIFSGKFSMYDYRRNENVKRYNASEPPDYPLKNIKTPIFLVISDSDILSDAWGSNTLFKELPPGSKKYGKMMVHNVNHAAYLVGKNRFEIFEKFLEIINSSK